MVAHFTFLLCARVFAQNLADAQLCEDFEQYRYIRTAEPARPNKPLRQDNITDDEVREVQGAALEVYPDSIVSISGVTDGCDCEDGSRCTAQVKSIYPPRKQARGFRWHKYTIDLMAFDCKDHRQRIDRMDTYYDDGTVEKYPGKDPVLWDPIRPGSDAAADLDLVCGWSRR